MAEKAKGSIIYEILIVVLAALLIASIIYPKKLKEREAINTEICRERMSEIFNAELQYQKYHQAYTDTFSKVLEFIRTDTAYAAYVDSMIVDNLDSVITMLQDFKQTEETILANIPAATDTILIDSLTTMQRNMKYGARELGGFVEFVHDKMKNLPNMPTEELRAAFMVVDSKQFTLNMDIVSNLVESGKLIEAEEAAHEVIDVINSVTAQFQSIIDEVPEYKSTGLDSLVKCPSVHEPYKLVYVDTSAIKRINIYCPIDSSDIEMIESNFLKSKFGGLDLENHGHIVNGEKSWETEQ